MLLQLSHFPPLFPSALHLPSHPHSPLTSCPWVIYLSSLASPFTILFLTSLCLLCTYNLCFLFSVPFASFSHPLPLISLHVISISVNLFLFQFAQFIFCLFVFLFLVCIDTFCYIAFEAKSTFFIDFIYLLIQRFFFPFILFKISLVEIFLLQNDIYPSS